LLAWLGSDDVMARKDERWNNKKGNKAAIKTKARARQALQPYQMLLLASQAFHN
jgi:hypothetical protein